MNDNEPDIVIVYYKNSFEASELAEIKNELAKHELQIVSHERSPYINASIDFFVPFVQILLSPDMISALYQGLLTNAAWDGIKTLLTYIFRKFRKKPVNKLQGGAITEGSANIHFVVGNNVLALPMNVDEEKFEYAVDKFMDASVTSNPTEVTYTFCADNGNIVFHKTEREIIQEEYEKQQKIKKNRR